jgi:hypothetical protein
MESADYGGLFELLGWKRGPRLGEPGITRGASSIARLNLHYRTHLRPENVPIPCSRA